MQFDLIKSINNGEYQVDYGFVFGGVRYLNEELANSAETTS